MRNADVKQRVERQIGDSVLAIETGFLAKQAAGSVLVSYGETVVLVASATGAPRPGIDARAFCVGQLHTSSVGAL